MPRADKVSADDVQHTLEWLSKEVNVHAEKLQKQIREENREAMIKFSSGNMTREDFIASWKEEPSRIKTKQFRHMARKFNKRRGYTKQRVNTSGSYLEYDDAKMQQRPSCNC